MTQRKRVTDSALTREDLRSLAAAVADAKRATVYLREATPSLNLPAGASAKVVRVDENTVVVRPRGVDDELPFEAAELRMTRLPTAAQAKSTAAQAKSTALMPAPAKSPAKPVPRSAKKIQDGISVTIHGGPDNDWTVSVAYGARAAGKATPVKPDAVERAVVELDDPTAREAVDAVLSVARDAVSSRIEELSRQLEEARNALAELGKPD